MLSKNFFFRINKFFFKYLNRVLKSQGSTTVINYVIMPFSFFPLYSDG